MKVLLFVLSFFLMACNGGSGTASDSSSSSTVYHTTLMEDFDSSTPKSSMWTVTNSGMTQNWDGNSSLTLGANSTSAQYLLVSKANISSTFNLNIDFTFVDERLINSVLETTLDYGNGNKIIFYLFLSTVNNYVSAGHSSNDTEVVIRHKIYVNNVLTATSSLVSLGRLQDRYNQYSDGLYDINLSIYRSGGYVWCTGTGGTSDSTPDIRESTYGFSGNVKISEKIYGDNLVGGTSVNSYFRNWSLTSSSGTLSYTLD